MSALRTLVLCICVVFIVSFLVVATDRDIRDLVASPILKPAAKVIPPLAQKPKTKTQVVKFPKVVNLETYGDFGIQKPVKILPSKKPPRLIKKIVKKPVPKNPPETKVKKKIKAPKERKVVNNISKPRSVSLPPNRETYPQLEIDYSEIGLERYLIKVEEIGKIYLVHMSGERGERRSIGRQVSFARRKLGDGTYGSTWRKMKLAIDRPYSITDKELSMHIGRFELPINVMDGQLILFLTKPFDEKLWRALERQLQKQGFTLSDIAIVKGEYRSESQHVWIEITEAITKKKKGEKKLRIGEVIHLPCRDCT